jgi:SPP1 gp7 family putative phage head morphogenesis protein
MSKRFGAVQRAVWHLIAKDTVIVNAGDDPANQILHNPSKGDLQALLDTVHGKHGSQRSFGWGQDRENPSRVVLRGVQDKHGNHVWGSAYKYEHVELHGNMRRHGSGQGPTHNLFVRDDGSIVKQAQGLPSHEVPGIGSKLKHTKPTTNAFDFATDPDKIANDRVVVNAETPLKLGNGHTLHLAETLHFPGDQKREIWHSRDEKGEVSGHFAVTHYPDSPHPAMDSSWAFQRGKGIGRHAIKALVKHYGSLRSSDNGMTSDDAAKAWRAVGAKHLGPENREGGESEFLVTNAFDFATDPDKIDHFQKWLQRQINLHILETRTNTGNPSLKKPWLAPRLINAYKIGLARAYTDVKRAGGSPPTVGLNLTPEMKRTMDSAYEAGKLQRHLEAGMAVSTRKVALIYTRAYHDLQGITQDMSTKLSRILATGMINGDSPHSIARKMVQQISGISLRRARLIATTELTNAHAEGTLDGLQALGVRWVSALVEFHIKDNRACPKCKALDGKRFTIDEARGKIAVHPGCRCCWIPVQR